MEYIIERELREIANCICETPVKYNVNVREKDKSFKVLFEVKEQFIQLLKTFVKDKWVDKVKEENIELVDKEFTTVNLEERRADVVYKININKQEIYFFLLEIQSTVDKMMPFRLYEYMMEIYRKYIRKEKLPIVIPCVLYTGTEKWKIGSMKSLFNVRKEIERYIPDFEYILLDVNNYTDDELLETCNLMSSVFYLVKSKDEKEVVKRIEELLKKVRKLTEEDQKSLLKWARTIFVKKEEVKDYIDYFEKKKKEEEEEMAFADLLPGAIELWREQCIEQGRNEGIKKGIKQGIELGRNEGILSGRQESKISSIKRILTKKLKEEPSKEVISKLETLKIPELEDIEDRIFEIETWEEIFS